MNERIRELIRKTSFIDTELLTEPQTVMLEKFAELVVKECMTVCEETKAEYLKHRKATSDFGEKNIYAEGEVASDVIKYKMKKYFGVKS